MIITNKRDLPAPFVRMAQSDYEYTPKRYSATTLLKSVREILLKRRHDAVLEQDCSDSIWMLFGKAVHYILEKYGTGKNEFVEEKLTVERIAKLFEKLPDAKKEWLLGYAEGVADAKESQRETREAGAL